MNQKVYTREMLNEKFSEDTSLKTIFQEIEAELKPTGQVVCQFRVNGLNLSEEAEQRLAQVKLADVEMIEVNSQNPAQILENVLQTWIVRIPGIIERNDELSKKIRLDGVEGGLKSFVELIDDCQLLVDSVISINTLFPHIAGVQSSVWRNAEHLIADGIGQSLGAFEKKDYPLLADILEYDLGHALQTWLETLTSFEATIQEMKRSGTPIEDAGSEISQSRQATE